jgi:hypothetical protein
VVANSCLLAIFPDGRINVSAVKGNLGGTSTEVYPLQGLGLLLHLILAKGQEAITSTS